MPNGHYWQNQNFKKLVFSVTCSKVGQKQTFGANPKGELFMHKTKNIYERRVYLQTEEENLTEKLEKRKASAVIHWNNQYTYTCVYST